MRISISILSVFLALSFGVAQAQGYRWVDKDGKVRYGDVPPPGVKATPMKGPASGSAPAPAPGAGGGGGASKAPASKDAAAKDAKKGPLTPAEQEQAYRERQLKSKEASEKADKERAEAEQNRQACASAQESLRALERGTRISTVNAQGETVFLEDDQRGLRIAQAQKVISQTCK
jgi:hypothetical protein